MWSRHYRAYSIFLQTRLFIYTLCYAIWLMYNGRGKQSKFQCNLLSAGQELFKQDLTLRLTYAYSCWVLNFDWCRKWHLIQIDRPIVSTRLESTFVRVSQNLNILNFWFNMMKYCSVILSGKRLVCNCSIKVLW